MHGKRTSYLKWGGAFVALLILLYLLIFELPSRRGGWLSEDECRRGKAIPNNALLYGTVFNKSGMADPFCFMTMELFADTCADPIVRTTAFSDSCGNYYFEVPEKDLIYIGDKLKNLRAVIELHHKLTFEISQVINVGLKQERTKYDLIYGETVESSHILFGFLLLPACIGLFWGLINLICAWHSINGQSQDGVSSYSTCSAIYLLLSALSWIVTISVFLKFYLNYGIKIISFPMLEVPVQINRMEGLDLPIYIPIASFLGIVTYSLFSLAVDRKVLFTESTGKEQINDAISALAGRIVIAPYIATIVYFLFFKKGEFEALSIFIAFFTGLWIKVVLDMFNNLGLKVLSQKAGQISEMSKEEIEKKFREELLSAKKEDYKKLQKIEEFIEKNEEELTSYTNVKRVEPGYKETMGMNTGIPSLVFYVSKKAITDAQRDGIQKEIPDQIKYKTEGGDEIMIPVDVKEERDE